MPAYALPSVHLASEAKEPVAVSVYGQPDFSTHAERAVDQSSLKDAGDITADGQGGFYVADYKHSRVLHFPAGNTTRADRVYGQPDFVATHPLRGQRGLNYPHGVVQAANGELYISDMHNNRILHYPAGSTTADRVYGQPDFERISPNSNGITATSLNNPQGLAVDASGLYVADSENNRILHFPTGSTTADFVYGQQSLHNFSVAQPGNGAGNLNYPRDVAVDSSGIYVADERNNRVVHYKPGNAVADFVYGQADMQGTAPNRGHNAPDAATLNGPTGVDLDKLGGLYIADRANNRVLYFAPLSTLTASGPSAVRIYGQRDYTGDAQGASISAFNGPGSVAVDERGNIFVLDIFNQRVLKFALGLRVTAQPPAHIAVGKTFAVSVGVCDVGSGQALTDATATMRVQLKPGTGQNGGALQGNVSVRMVKGVARFQELAISQPGQGYVLSFTSSGFVPGETTAFTIENATTTTSSPSTPRQVASEPWWPLAVVAGIVLLAGAGSVMVWRRRKLAGKQDV